MKRLFNFTPYLVAPSWLENNVNYHVLEIYSDNCIEKKIIGESQSFEKKAKIVELNDS